MTKAEFAWLVVAGVVICFFAGSVRADDRLWISASLRAWHSDRAPASETYGIGVEYERGPISAVYGEYHNSIGHTSAYGGLALRPLRFGPFRAGIVCGAVTGYERGLVWMVLPMLSVEVRRVGINLIGAPSIAGSPAMIALQVKWAL